MENSDEDSLDGEQVNIDEEVASHSGSEYTEARLNSNPSSPIHSPSPPHSPSDPKSPSPPPQSPISQPQSPHSPESRSESPGYHTPQSPPSSPHSLASVPQSQLSGPQSPASGPESPASGPRSPASAPQSPASGPQSPAYCPQSPASAPQSPASVPGSPGDEQHSEDEVLVSDAEEQNDQDEAKADDADRHSDVEEEGGKGSDSEPEQDKEAEDSEQEENVPEINIDSGDEDNDRASPSRNSNQSGSEDEENKESDQEMKVAEKHVSESEDSDNEIGNSRNRLKSLSPVSKLIKTRRARINKIVDDDDEDEEEEEEKKEEVKSSPQKEENNVSDVESDNDANSDSEESEVGGLIADIFGESDDDEEFEGFNEEDLASSKAKKDKKKRTVKVMSDSEGEGGEEKEGEIIEDVPAPETENLDLSSARTHAVSDDDSDDDGNRKMREDFVSDFDLMMQKKKDESSRKRRRRDVDIINDSDDLIADIISQMRQAADEDRLLNKHKKTATKKLKILPMVMSQLKKQDLKMAFLDQGVLNVMADWLAPLPDRSLPHLNIREGMIKQLEDFPAIDQSLLKSSGVGRALMYLFKHPKETKENREKMGKLITEWARPIFNVTTNYHSLTKEEREQRDYDHIPKRKKTSKEIVEQEQEEAESRKDIDNALTSEDKSSLRPGDKGWVGRARVPMPSTKDYVYRPKWNVEMEFGRSSSKKPLNRFDKHMRALNEKKKQSKGQRAITISIEGRKMAI